MKHKHADLMLLYANDAQETDKPWERWEWKPRGVKLWTDAIDGIDMDFNEEDCYRRIDPYAELKEAQERGEVIQWLNDFDLWVDTKTPIRTCRKSYPPDRYRIKPKEKKPEVFEGKSFYMKETGTAWVGVINGQEVTIVARGATGLDLYNCSLDDDEVDEILKPYKYHYGRVQRIDSSMIEVDA